jgi:cytochrome c-type biogenesis protein CcmH/NrfG
MSRFVTAALFGVLLTSIALGGPPREAVSANERGIAHLAAGRAVPATAAFRVARELLPGNVLIARNLAVALAAQAERAIQARRPDEAIAMLREARELHPERLRYRAALARAYLRTKRDHDRLSARDQLVAVLEVDPDHLDALLLLASIDWNRAIAS